MSGNSTSGSFGTGPASGYFLNFMFMFIVFVTSTLVHALNFIYKNVMIYALIFGIKINRNWPLIPTIQKLDRAFLVSGFAAHLKPNSFDGTNYKRWVRKLELWLISMSVWFITEGPTTGPHTLEDERTYQTADNLFRGAVISVLERTWWMLICIFPLARKCGTHLKQSLVPPMQAVSCTSWRAS